MLVFSHSVMASPKITIKHERNKENYAQIKIINETLEKLSCYVAIDGHKINFTLAPRESSPWYKATDTRFNYTHFSTSCKYQD